MPTAEKLEVDGAGADAFFGLRLATAADRSFLDALFLTCQRSLLGFAGPDETQLEQILQMQLRAQRAGYAQQFPAAQDWVIEDLKTPPTMIGRMLVDDSGESVRLVDVALMPESRGAGVGTAVITDLLSRARAAGKTVCLRVRLENRAIHLYRRLGFTVVSSGMDVEMEHRPGSTSSVDAAGEVSSTYGADWKAEVGRKFTAQAQPSVDLRLSEFVRGRAGNSFSLLFDGPEEPVLTQGMYLLAGEETVADTLKEQALFLVPIGQERNATQYEAVFQM